MGFPIQRIQDAPAEMLRKLKNQEEDFPQLAQEKQTMYLDLFPRNCDGEVITLVISSIEVIYLQWSPHHVYASIVSYPPLLLWFSLKIWQLLLLTLC